MLTRVFNSVLSLLGSGKKNPQITMARKPSSPFKRSTNLRLECLETRENAAAFSPYLFADISVVTPLNADMVSVTGGTAPGLGIDVIDDGVPAGFDLFVNVNAVHGFSFVAKLEGSPYAVTIGSAFTVDGLDQLAITYVIRTQERGGAKLGTININDPVLLPFAPANLVPGVNPVVYTVPGPYGTGAGPFG